MQKNVVIVIIITVLLVIAYSFYAKKDDVVVEQNYISEVNRNLSTEQQDVYFGRIDEANAKLAGELSDEDRQSWLLQKGIQFSGLGRLADAENIFEEAKNIKKEALMPYALLYQVQLERGKNNDALSNIKEAITIKPNSADLWKKYIIIQKEVFKIDNASIDAIYSEALVKTEFDIDVLTAYASWLKEIGEYQKSKDYWNMAIEINPDNRSVYEAEINSM